MFFVDVVWRKIGYFPWPVGEFFFNLHKHFFLNIFDEHLFFFFKLDCCKKGWDSPFIRKWHSHIIYIFIRCFLWWNKRKFWALIKMFHGWLQTLRSTPHPQTGRSGLILRGDYAQPQLPCPRSLQGQESDLPWSKRLGSRHLLGRGSTCWHGQLQWLFFFSIWMQLFDQLTACTMTADVLWCLG
jgi:hypothetical protein